MPIPELLAPAGSYETFVVAVNAGADAVYISGERFGARAFAKNFSLEEMGKAVQYAHLNGVKVHVTVNTLVNNFEIVDVIKYLFKLYQMGVDAVIVQDLGIIKLIKNLIPALEVHASTQMTLSDYNCILWAVDNSIDRIVFPREISVDKINEINSKLKESNLDIELEVFGHGALCYCFSGNCYISSYNSGRSGNRGACAQPCRKQYKLKYKNYNVGNGFLLSTHDLAVYNGLDKLEDAGVYSLKLEGRMKSSDYVGTIVNAYRHLIDGTEGNKEKYIQDLNLVFNRQFTDGYILNQKPGDVLGRKSSGHEGVYIGKIISKKGEEITIGKENSAFQITLNIGDGIGFKYKDKIKGIYIDNIIKQTKEYIKLNTTRNVREGDKVYLSYSKNTHDSLKKFKDENIKQHIPISISIDWNSALNLIVNCEFEVDNKKSNFNYISDIKAEKAINRPITEEDIKKQLSKTGDTPFYIKNIEIKNMKKDIFIPIGKLNKIRRNILDKATDLLLDYSKPNKAELKKTRKNINNFVKEYNSYSDVLIKNEDLKLATFIDDIEVLKTSSKLPISKYYFDPSFSFNSTEEYFENIEYILKTAYSIVEKNNSKKEEDEKSQLIWVLSSFISDEEIDKISKIIDNLNKESIKIPIMYDTPGIAKSCNTKVYGNHNLNVWNSYNIKNLSDSGFEGVLLSSELSNKEIKEAISKYQYIKDKDTEISIIAQGNLEVMSSKDDFSNLNEGRDFIINDSSDYAILEDQKRKKFKYKVVFDYNKHSHFINKDCLCLVSDLELIKEIGVDTIIVDCRFSSTKYSSTILSLYAQALKINKTNKEYDLYLFKEQIESITLSRLNKGNFPDGRIHEKD